MALVVFLLGGLIVGGLRYRAVRQDLLHHTRHTLDLAEAQIQDQVYHYNKHIQHLRSRLDTEAAPSRILAQVRRHLHLHGAKDVYYVLGPQGRARLLSPGYEAYQGFDFSSLASSKEPSKATGNSLAPYQSLLTQASVVPLIYTLPHGYRLVIERNLANILPAMERFQNSQQHEQGVFFVLTSNGRVVYHPRQEWVETRYNLGFLMQACTQITQHELCYYQFQDRSWLAMQRQLEVLPGWRMYYTLPQAVLLEQVFTAVAVQVGSLCLFVIVLFGLLQGLLQRFLTRPVGRISERIQHADTTGNLDLPASLARGCDELQQIIQAVLTRDEAMKKAKQALEQEKERLRVTLRSIGDGVITTDTAGKVVMMNPVAETLTGWEGPQAQGMPLQEVFHVVWERDDGSEEGPENPAAAVLASGEVLTLANNRMLVSRDGKRYVIADSAAPIRQGQLDMLGVVVVFRDVTADYQVRRELREQQRRLQTLFAAAADVAFVMTDVAGEDARVQEFSPGAEHIFGYSREEILGQPVAWLHLSESVSQFPAIIERMRRNGQGLSQETTLVRKDGSSFPALFTSYPLFDEREHLYATLGVTIDITERKRIEKQLEYQAHHDPLTDLANRTLFRVRLEHAMARCQREGQLLAVVMLDMDRFKDINDSLGHSVGDKLICRVARQLMAQLRLDDTVARQGGDEFLLLLEGLHSQEALTGVLDKLLRLFEEPFTVDEYELRISVSLGVALFPDHGADIDSLIKNADAAMYRAKQEGGNTFYFYAQEMTQQALERLTLEGEMRQGLKTGQFQLHYQPQVDMASGCWTGLEALVRWQHPHRGMVSPGQFIPVAEASGLIVPLGMWVLQQACKQARQWLDEGYPLGRIAVNVAALQFQQDDFAATVEEALQTSGLDPAHLELEITETALMEPTSDTIDMLIYLRQLGVTLAIDDFGTGYSSLAYLKRLPIDKLKLDKSFVDDLPADDNDAAIARAVVALSRTLNLAVVAEGVETEAQRLFLLQEGAPQAQGFLWARPAAEPDWKKATGL